MSLPLLTGRLPCSRLVCTHVMQAGPCHCILPLLHIPVLPEFIIPVTLNHLDLSHVCNIFLTATSVNQPVLLSCKLLSVSSKSQSNTSSQADMHACIVTMNRICNSKLDTRNVAQALAVGKPLDKMESVPEVAMEGLPSGESLHESDVSIRPNQGSHIRDQVMPFSHTCNMGTAQIHTLRDTV